MPSLYRPKTCCQTEPNTGPALESAPEPLSAEQTVAGHLLSTARYTLHILSAGKLVLHPLVAHRVSSSAAQEAYSGFVSRRDEFLGIVLAWENGLR